ncbi:MAG TPA: SH3 domain-containing protein [Parvibaculum sp.]
MRTIIIAFSEHPRGRRRVSGGFKPGLAAAVFFLLLTPAAAGDAPQTPAPTHLLAPGPTTLGTITPPKTTVGPASGLPVPRYVSLKSGRINVRRGPGDDYPIEWVFEKRGLPVEVTAESDRWRRIRDREGDVGWVWHSMLDGRRTALVENRTGDTAPVAIHGEPDPASSVVAYAEAGVIAQLVGCKGVWCEVKASGYEGWTLRDQLWGTYPGENFD